MGPMAGTERQISRPDGGKGATSSAQPPRKPLQVMHISKREEQERLRKEAEQARAAADAAAARAEELEQAALAAEGGQAMAPRHHPPPGHLNPLQPKPQEPPSGTPMTTTWQA